MMRYDEFVTAGTPATPLHIVINYQKIKGTEHISHWMGTVELQKLTENVTGFVMRDQLKATTQNSDNSVASLKELYSHFKTLPPNWKYLGQ
jgi:hypothetical protein